MRVASLIFALSINILFSIDTYPQPFDTSEILYDDGRPEQWFTVGFDLNDKAAVRFSSPYLTPPSRVLRARLLFNASRTISYALLCRGSYSEPDTTPAGIYQRINNINTLTEPNWTIINFDSNLCRITTQYTWLVFCWPNSSSGPAIGGDQSFPINNCSFWYSEDFGWNPLTNMDLMIRILASKASYDVCPVSVENPRTGVRVDTPYTVRAKIRNQGMYTVSYPVYCYIRRRDNLLVYADTFLVTNHGINTDIQITFTPDWMPKDYDERFTITVITDLTNDNDRSNDTIRAYTNSYGLGEIAYDDFGPEAWIVVNSPNGPDDYLATRFTPFYAPPYYLTRFRIFVNSMTRLRDVKICPDSAGRPDLNRPFVQRNDLSSSTAPGWIDITFPAVTVSTPGDIWLTAHYYSGLIGPAVGADTNLPIDRRSYLSSNGGASWIQITNQDLIMRIFHRDTLATITEDQKTRIDQPLPNPVRSKLKIILPRCPGSLVFYDAQGRKVREIRLSGQDSYEWDLTDAKQQKLPAGIYFYQIALEKKKKMGKILLVR